MPSMPASVSNVQSTLPFSASYACTFLSRVPTKINPVAVATGPAFGNCDPVSVMPLAASSGISPTGIFHLMVPVVRSNAVIDVHGGASAFMPCVVTRKPRPLVYGIDPSYCGTAFGGSDSFNSDGQSFETT